LQEYSRPHNLCEENERKTPKDNEIWRKNKIIPKK